VRPYAENIGPWIAQMIDTELAKEAMNYVMSGANMLPLPIAAEILKRFAKSKSDNSPPVFNPFTIGIATSSFRQYYALLSGTKEQKEFEQGFKHFQK
jgi:hypothetical protein